MRSCEVVISSVAAVVIAISVGGCGSSDSPTTTTMTPATTTPTPATITTSTTTPTGPIRAIAYGALPVKDGKWKSGRPSADMVQAGYEMQWGAKGRDDLANIKAMGANSVRLYHSLGLDTKDDHSGFLNRAEEVGLKVMPGMHSDWADIRTDLPPKKCGTDFDCFSYTKGSFLKGLKSQGYAREGKWHPAVSTVILLNEPDFLDDMICPNKSRWCSNKIILSAFEGVLAAEKEAGIEGLVSISTCMSLAQRTSLDGKVTGPGIFGFQDMDIITQNPSLAHYEPKTNQKELRAAFESRWVHCVNVPTPWQVSQDAYNKARAQGFTFGDRPWLLGETAFHNMNDDQILADFKSMEAASTDENDNFLGFGVFQYQTAYWKDGDYEKGFGMFGLGDQVVGNTDDICTDGGFYDYPEKTCLKFPVYCLTIPQAGQYGAGRAATFAQGWNGNVDRVKTCSKESSSVTVV